MIRISKLTIINRSADWTWLSVDLGSVGQMFAHGRKKKKAHRTKRSLASSSPDKLKFTKKVMLQAKAHCRQFLELNIS